MLCVTGFDALPPDRFDESYAIMRSLSARRRQEKPWVKQMRVLSPEKPLLDRFLELRRDDRWNYDSFKTEYLPAFVEQISKDDAAVSAMAGLARAARTKNIAIACSCGDEKLCHRSIVASIIGGMNRSLDIYTDSGLLYPDYAALFAEKRKSYLLSKGLSKDRALERTSDDMPDFLSGGPGYEYKFF